LSGAQRRAGAGMLLVLLKMPEHAVAARPAMFQL
jgi:hypothetical protein